MGEDTNAQNIADITPFERIMRVTGSQTQIQLAEKLGIRQSSISAQLKAKNQDAVPPGWLITLLKKYGVNPLWVLYGTGPVCLDLMSKEDGSTTLPQTKTREIINNIKLITLMPEIALRYFTTTALMREIYRRIVKTENAFLDLHEGRVSEATRRLAEDMAERDTPRS